MIVMDIERIDLQTSKLEVFNPKTNQTEIQYIYDTEHIATDWEISDSLDFKNILVSSYENYNYKRTIIFSENLDTNIRYYGRARALLKDRGYTEWGNVHIFTMRNDSNLKPQDVFPTRVGTPIIKTYRMNLDTTIDDVVSENSSTPNVDNSPWDPIGSGSSNQQFANVDEIIELLESIDPDCHDLALFEIWVDGFEIIGNAKHLATSWWIEDNNGDVIWKSLDDVYNLRRVQVKNIMLKKDRVYRIRAMFHATSRDASQIGTYTITTNSSEYGILSSYLDLVNPALDTELVIEFEQGVTYVRWEVISYEFGILTPVWSSVSNGIVDSIPKNTLKYNTNYILRVKTNLSKSWNYYPFITSQDAGIGMDSNLTPVIIYPTSFVLAPTEKATVYININAKASCSYEIDFPDVVSFNPNGQYIEALSPGSATIFLSYKQDGYAERIVRLSIEVLDLEANTNASGGYVKVSPNEIQMKNEETHEFTLLTNCDKWIVEHDENLGTVTVTSGKTFKYTPKLLGLHNLIVIAYATDSNMVASDPINVKVVAADKKPEDGKEEDVSEYYFKVDVDHLDLISDEVGEINVVTNCKYWNIMQITDESIIRTDITGNNIKVTPKKVGETSIILAGDNGIKDDIGISEVNVVVSYKVGVTTFAFDSRNYTLPYGNELKIPFTTNCEDLDEVEFLIDGYGITIIRKTLEYITILADEGSEDQEVIIYVYAKITTTLTDTYNAVEDMCKITIPKIPLELDEVIRIPATTTTYGDGLYGVDTFQPSNPLKLAIHVYKDIETTEGMIITGVPYSNETGTVKELELGPQLVDSDGIMRFRILYIYVVTNKDPEQPYGPGDTNDYIINLQIPYNGAIYRSKFTATPADVTTLEVTDTEDLYFANVGDKKEISYMTNADDVTYSVKDENIVLVEKNNSEFSSSIFVTCMDISKSTELTLSATNSSNFTKSIKISLYIGNLYEEIGISSAIADWTIENWKSRSSSGSSDDEYSEGEYIEGEFEEGEEEENEYTEIDLSNYYLDNDPVGIFPPIEALDWDDTKWTVWAGLQYVKWKGKTTELAELAKKTIVTRPIVGSTVKTPTKAMITATNLDIIRVSGVSKFKSNNKSEVKLTLYITTGPNPIITIEEGGNGEYNDLAYSQFYVSKTTPILVADPSIEKDLDQWKIADETITTIYKCTVTITMKNPSNYISDTAFRLNITADITGNDSGLVKYKEATTIDINISNSSLTYSDLGFRDARKWTDIQWGMFKPGANKPTGISNTDSVNNMAFPIFASSLNAIYSDNLDESIPLYDIDPMGLIPPLSAMNWTDNQWNTWITQQVDKFYNKTSTTSAIGTLIETQNNGEIATGNMLIHTASEDSPLTRYKSIHTDNDYTVESITTGKHLISSSIKISSIQISSLNVDDTITLGRLALYSNGTKLYPIMAKNKGNGVYYVILAPYTPYILPEQMGHYVTEEEPLEPYDFSTYKEDYPMSYYYLLDHYTQDDFPEGSKAYEILDPSYADEVFELAIVKSDGTVTPISVYDTDAETLLEQYPEAYKYNNTIDTFTNVFGLDINEQGEIVNLDDGYYTESYEVNNMNVNDIELSEFLLENDGNMRDLAVYPLRPEEVLMVIDYGSYEVDSPYGLLCVANVHSESKVTTLTAKDGNRNFAIGITSANTITSIELDNGNGSVSNAIKLEVSVHKDDTLDYYTNDKDIDIKSEDLSRAVMKLGTNPDENNNVVMVYDKENINNA